MHFEKLDSIKFKMAAYRVGCTLEFFNSIEFTMADNRHYLPL